MKRFVGFITLVTLALAAPGPVAAAEQSAPKKEGLNTTQVLMRQKLEAAHGLLEGIVKEDFSAIDGYAATLANIGKATEWHKGKDTAYMEYSGAFQRSVAYLQEQSQAKSTEGVALGYVRVTLDCMQCHNFVRAKRSR